MNHYKIFSKIGFVFMLGAMLKMTAALIIANGVRLPLEGDSLRWLFEFLSGFAVYLVFGNKQAG